VVILALLGVASFVIGTEIIIFYEYPDLCLNELKRGFAPVTPIPFLSSCPPGLAGGDTKKESKKVKAVFASLEKPALDD